MQQADEVHPDVGRPGPLGLLEEDQVLGGRRAPAAELRRPVDARVAGVVEQPLPGGVVLAGGLPVVLVRGRAPMPGSDLVQPRPELGPELLLLVGVAQVHGAGSRMGVS